MPRAKTILQSVYPYQITARSINREWFHVPMSLVWVIFSEELTETSKQHNLLIHSFVLMSNHFHLIASTPDANISTCMQQFMYRSSRRLTRAGNRINQTFAGRHYKCILHQSQYYLNAYKYNYRNPVTAGICARVEDYPYSTLPAVMKLAVPTIPLCDDLTYLANPAGTLAWLNTEPEPQKLEGVRFGLRHQYFKSKKDNLTHRALIADYDTL